MKEKNNSVIKNVIWAIISFIIAFFTIYTIINESKVFSIDVMISLIKGGSPVYLLCAFICMLLFILMEAQAIKCILQKIWGKTSHGDSVLYAAADIYFSAITPSASGGQPASLYFMLKDGISISEGTICLLYNLLMYNASIIFISVLTFIFARDIFMGYAIVCKIFIIVGIVVLLFLMMLFYLLLKKTSWLYFLGSWMISFCHKIRIIHNKEKWIAKMNRTIEQYSSLSETIFEDKVLAVRIFIWNLLQRSIQITISVFIYLGLGGSYLNIVKVWFTQAYAVIGSNCVPIPGAMGIIDYLLIEGFQNIMSEMMAVHTEMLSRGCSFYICILISLLTVVFGYFRKKRS